MAHRTEFLTVPAQVRAVQEPWDSLDYFSFVTKRINPDNDQTINQLWNEFFRPYSNTLIRPSLEETERFINANNLMTDDIRERLADWRHYRQHKTHRRREVWEARNNHEW